MKTIFDILKNDIRAIVKYILVLIVVIALGTMPSLYAWINIYGNWDPYVNTGNLPVALASRDSGIEQKNGTHINNAEEVIADVKDDEDIAYTPLDDPEEAIEGVQMEELSMGMSQDYDLAARAGATMVRVGSALFR